jgi:hypothetical protein
MQHVSDGGRNTGAARRSLEGLKVKLQSNDSEWVIGNLNSLVNALTDHGQDYDSDEFGVALAQLQEICVFLDSIEVGNAIAPLWALLRDANDIRNGAKPNLIIKAQNNPGRPNARTYDAFVGFQVGLMDVLMEAGYSTSDAAEFVVQHLTTKGLQNSALCPMKLTNARNRMDARGTSTAETKRNEIRKLLKDEVSQGVSPLAAVADAVNKIPRGLVPEAKKPAV